MVIINTNAVATIIQAVSAVLISEFAACAGEAMANTSPIGAAIVATRRNNPAMSFPPGSVMASHAMASLPGGAIDEANFS
jgi:hypothetical protein